MKLLDIAVFNLAERTLKASSVDLTSTMSSTLFE